MREPNGCGHNPANKERMVIMKGKILTWNEFREICREDAFNWYHAGWRSSKITEEDILNEYPEEYFCDDTGDDYDGFSSCFIPQEFATKTIEYMEALEMD